MISWIARVLKGMIIALGFILPGVSGGVLAAILGIYERMIRFLAHIKENFVENVLYFTPVAIGMVLGIAAFSYPVNLLLDNYKVIVLWGFAGAIIGTIPSLIKESVKESDRDRADTVTFWLSFILSGIFLYSLNGMVGTLPANFLSFVLAGALIALGILIPGLYTPMLTGFKRLDLFGTFLPIGIGGALALILFSKAMDYILKHYHSRVYHFIIGIVLSSTLLIVLPQTGNSESISYAGVSIFTLVLAAFFFGLGIWLGIWMSQLEEKYK